MIDRSLNDNGVLGLDHQPRCPDAHGQATMLLTESVIHGLIARSVISVGDAIEIVEVAVEVKLEVAADLGDLAVTMLKSLTILEAIKTSLSHDHVDGHDDAAPSV